MATAVAEKVRLALAARGVRARGVHDDILSTIWHRVAPTTPRGTPTKVKVAGSYCHRIPAAETEEGNEDYAQGSHPAG